MKEGGNLIDYHGCDFFPGNFNWFWTKRKNINYCLNYKLTLKVGYLGKEGLDYYKN